MKEIQPEMASMRDSALESYLIERLAPIEVPLFVAPTGPQARTLSKTEDVLRPSSMGKCERALALLVGSLPVVQTIDASTLTKFDFGTHVHGVVQKALAGARHEVKVRRGSLKGSFDTELLDFPCNPILDWKTADKRTSSAVKKAGAPRDDHAAQVNFYAVANGSQRAAVVYLPKVGDTQIDLSGLVAFSFDADVGLADEWEAKAQRVRAHVERKTLPPIVELLECRWCPVKSQCVRSQGADPTLDIWHSKIVGTTFRDQSLADIGLTVGEKIALVWEPDNEHGSRLDEEGKVGAAVKACRQDGHHLGYLPDSNSPTAALVAHHLRRGGTAHAVLTELTGGTAEKTNVGLNIEVWLSAGVRVRSAFSGEK